MLRNGENTGKEWEVIVVQLVFDCILDDVFQLKKNNTSKVSHCLTKQDFKSSCPSAEVVFFSNFHAT